MAFSPEKFTHLNKRSSYMIKMGGESGNCIGGNIAGKNI